MENKEQIKEVNFVNPEELTTIEDYAASLLSSLISIKTIEAFQLSAFKKGLLDKDEEETSKTICWEIQRLIMLYKSQIEHVLDRTELKEEDVMQALKAMIPDVKIPKKKSKKDGATKNK